jgi:hypothetical protein
MRPSGSDEEAEKESGMPAGAEVPEGEEMVMVGGVLGVGRAPGEGGAGDHESGRSPKESGSDRVREGPVPSAAGGHGNESR